MLFNINLKSKNYFTFVIVQQIKDATPAILVAISMFIFPANFHQFTTKSDSKSNTDIKRLLNWKVVQSGITWGVVFLLGGGFALAYGIQVKIVFVSVLFFLIFNFFNTEIRPCKGVCWSTIKDVSKSKFNDGGPCSNQCFCDTTDK